MCNGALAGLPRPAMDREIRLEPTPHAPRKAREFVSYHFTELGFPRLVEDGKLIADELVTNSLNAAPESPLWLDVRQAGSFLILEDWDRSTVRPVAREPDLITEGGRGLHIVTALSVDWGCDIFSCGKCVWVLLRGDGQ
jgi:hypothetical protein